MNATSYPISAEAVAAPMTGYSSISVNPSARDLLGLVPDDERTWNGPRNLPAPSDRKKKRTVARKARKKNRGTYRG